MSARSSASATAVVSLAATMALASLAVVAPARAGQRTADWLGGPGDWRVASNWSGGVVPDNAGGDTYRVRIDGGRAGASRVGLGNLDLDPLPNFTVDELAVDPGDALSIEPSGGLTALNGAAIDGTVEVVNGYLGVGGAGVTTAATAPGGGTVTLDNGRLGAAGGGPLVIGPGVTVRNAPPFDPRVPTGGTVGGTTAPLVNRGSLLAADGGTLVVAASALDNSAGLARVDAGGTLRLDVPYRAFADLGRVENDGGTVVLDGVADNAGRTLRFDRSAGLGDPALGTLQLGGTVRGGVLQTAVGERLTVAPPPTSAASLDGVTLDGDLDLPGTTLFVRGGLSAGPRGADVRVAGGQVYGGAGGLEVGAGVTVHGSGTVGNFAPLVNRGTLRADGRFDQLTVTGRGIDNQGVIDPGEGIVRFEGEYRLPGLGPLRPGGRYRFGGTIDLAGDALVNGRRLAADGTPDPAGTPFEYDLTSFATVRGGTVRTLPGHDLVLDGNGTGFGGGTFDGVTLDGTVRIANSAFSAQSFTIANGLRGTGTVRVQGGVILSPEGRPLVIGDGITITGGGALVGLRNRRLESAGRIVAEAGRTLRVAGDEVVISGVLAAERSGVLAVTGDLTVAAGGTLALQPLGTGDAPLQITGDLDLSAAGDALDLGALRPDASVPPLLVLTYAGALAGRFDRVTPGFLLDYSRPGFVYAAVPDPASSAAGVAAAAAGLLRRRRPSVAPGA